MDTGVSWKIRYDGRCTGFRWQAAVATAHVAVPASPSGSGLWRRGRRPANRQPGGVHGTGDLSLQHAAGRAVPPGSGNGMAAMRALWQGAGWVARPAAPYHLPRYITRLMVISRNRPVPAAHLSFIRKSFTCPPEGSSRITLLSCPPMSMTVSQPGQRKSGPGPVAGDLRDGLVRLRQQRPAIAGGHHKGGVGGPQFLIEPMDDPAGVEPLGSIRKSTISCPSNSTAFGHGGAGIDSHSEQFCLPPVVP